MSTLEKKLLQLSTLEFQKDLKEYQEVLPLKIQSILRKYTKKNGYESGAAEFYFQDFYLDLIATIVKKRLSQDLERMQQQGFEAFEEPLIYFHTLIEKTFQIILRELTSPLLNEWERLTGSPESRERLNNLISQETADIDSHFQSEIAIAVSKLELLSEKRDMLKPLNFPTTEIILHVDTHILSFKQKELKIKPSQAAIIQSVMRANNSLVPYQAIEEEYENTIGGEISKTEISKYISPINTGLAEDKPDYPFLCIKNKGFKVNQKYKSIIIE